MSDVPLSGVSAVNDGRRLLSGREKIGVGCLILAAIGGVALWPAGSHSPTREEAKPLLDGGRSVPYQPLPEAQLAALTVPNVGPMAMPAQPMPSAVVRPNPSPIMSYEDKHNAPDRDGVERVTTGERAAGPAPQPDDTLGAKLRSSKQQPVKATRMQNPELTIPLGRRIPCLPDMPIDSSIAGFFSCTVTDDVRGLSPNGGPGSVVLLNRGATLTGEVRSGVTRGSRRLFVVMTMARNTDNVEIELNSPGADILGSAGLDGEVDGHFFERFKGAMLLAFIDTSLQAAAIAASSQLASNGGVSVNQFSSGGRRAADTALESDINIPSTLTRLQGQPMTVFVARNLDFSGVYTLRALR